jgi:drug/metabolite transporter (DMT)-like permease
MATAFFFVSLAYISLPEATALADTSPVLITLGAALFLGEKLGPRRIFGVVAALIGALIIIRPGAEVFTLAALLPLANAVAYAGNALLTRHIGMKEPFWTSLMYGALFGAILGGFALPFVWVTPTLPDLGLFFLVGCLGTAAQLCIIRSFSTTEASVVAPFTYLGILFSTPPPTGCKTAHCARSFGGCSACPTAGACPWRVGLCRALWPRLQGTAAAFGRTLR